MIKALETAISKIRELPEEKQRAAAAVLEEIAATDHLYVLSGDERAVLDAAMERASRGEFAEETDIKELWRKCGL